MRFLFSLYKRIESFDILSLLEVISLYFKLHLSGNYLKSQSNLSSVFPSIDSILRWTALILDTGLTKILGHKSEYEIALTQLKDLLEEWIKENELENTLKCRLETGINKNLSLPSVSQSDIILETVYL